MAFAVEYKSLLPAMKNSTLTQGGGFSLPIPLLQKMGTRGAFGDVHGSTPVIIRIFQDLDKIDFSKEGYSKIADNYETLFPLLPMLPMQITKLTGGGMTPKEFGDLTGLTPLVRAEDLKTKGRSYAQNLASWMRIEDINQRLFDSLNFEAIGANLQEYLELIKIEIKAPLTPPQAPVWSLGDQGNDRCSDLLTTPLLDLISALLNLPNQPKQFRQLYSNHLHRADVHVQEKKIVILSI